MGVRAVVERRVARLSQACHNLLGVASVVGQVVDPGLLTLVAGVPGRSVVELLEEAQDARMLVCGDAPSGPVRFAHDLFRETLYQQMAATVRSDLHLRVGLALERRASAGVEVAPSELAHHFLRAESEDGRARSIRYSLDAARAALARLAAPEALAHAERALDAIGDRDRQDEADRLEALLVLAEAAWRAGDGERARHTFGRVAGLARRVADAEALGRAALGVHRMGVDYGTSGELLRRCSKRRSTPWATGRVRSGLGSWQPWRGTDITTATAVRAPRRPSRWRRRRSPLPSAPVIHPRSPSPCSPSTTPPGNRERPAAA
jgi:hypothetical protein